MSMSPGTTTSPFMSRTVVPLSVFPAPAGRGRDVPGDPGHLAVPDQDIHGAVDVLGGIDEPPIFEKQGHCFPPVRR
jgi:hypothetical protein